MAEIKNNAYLLIETKTNWLWNLTKHIVLANDFLLTIKHLLILTEAYFCLLFVLSDEVPVQDLQEHDLHKPEFDPAF